MRLASMLALCALTIATASAHPGVPHSTGSPGQHKRFMTDSKRLLASCAGSESTRQLMERTAARRASKSAQLRQKRRRLDADTVLATDHESSRTGLSASTDASELFGSAVSCVLEPEVTLGPYYVSGELVRSDIREDQAGVDLFAELQIIDVNTCEPVEGLYVDFWHCNATGVYSGVVARGNGDSSDASNVDKTFMRGLSPTDADGIASFTTKFPGHYSGRAIHIHVLGTYNGSLLANNTYSGGLASHVGQIFFDQSLISQVETTRPYSSNTQELTLNEDDRILTQSAENAFDPVMQYVLLGDDVADGVLAWISIGVDMTRAEQVSPAVQYTGDGGVDPGSGTSGGGTSSPDTGGGGTSSSEASGNSAMRSGSSGGWVALLSLVVAAIAATK